MKNRRALTFAIGLGILSFMLLFFYVQNMEARFYGQNRPVKVLIAKRDILQNERIDETMLEIREIPLPYVQPLVETPETLETVLRQAAAVTIKKGEQILQTKLNTLGEAGVSTIIEKGQRACTISVTEVTGVGGHIRNGDTVDVIGTFKTLGEKRTVKDLQAVTLFQNVPVLATGRNYLFDPNAQPVKSKNGMIPIVAQQTGFSTVTLKVTPRMCMDLAIAQQTGTLTLALRSKHDRFTSEVDQNLKTQRSTTESVTGIKESIQIKETPQWLEQRGDITNLVP